jgi:ABC-type polysaccharide/polyol phosphate transport system ATPase subunit/LPS sulfotransferase NodH/SAM-dependent methyltransferase
MPPIITVEQVSKIYPLYGSKRDRLMEALDPFRRKRHTDFYALRDISFTVEKGECIGIIGVNGSGKSTLLKILTGVLTPSAGRVEVQGRVSALLELGAGFHPERSGMENIYFMGALQGLSEAEIEKHVPDVVRFADIGEFIDQPVKLYSSGMFVRLAFAAAIQGNPDILIVDEALAVGDAAFQFKCVSRMKKLMKEGVTVLFVSHDASTIKSFCQRCVLLSRGQVKALGPAPEIADLYLRKQRDYYNTQIEGAFDKDFGNNGAIALSTVVHKVDPDFERKVIRHGTGDVQFTCVEVLDANGTALAQVEFDQEITIRLHLRFRKAGATHVGYVIRNKRNEPIIGSGTGLEGRNVLRGEVGDRYIIDFTTKVPLLEGAYSVMASATTRLSEGAFQFNDMAENVAVFEVKQRLPRKIWCAACVPNTLAVHYAGKEGEFACVLCGKAHSGYLPLWKEMEDSLAQYGFDAGPLQVESANRSKLSCPVCGGMDRERMSGEYLLRRLGAGFANPEFRFLEFAPNPAFSNFLKRNFSFCHETADLLRTDVDHQIVMTCMPLIATESVDAWISLHMLEHIPDDLAALRELYRILKPGGFGILLAPLSLALKKSDEDPQAPVEERWRRFGQDDHIRMYAKNDFIERIGKADFSLLQLGKDWFGAECFQRLGLPDTAVLYVVKKRMPEHTYYFQQNSAEFDEPLYDGRPERVFIIASTPRVGSSLLTRGLMSIGAIAASTEYFNVVHRADFEARWGALSDQDYLENLMRHRTRADGLFSVKAHYNHFALYESYLESYNLHFISIQRNDTVRQAVSWFKGELTTAWSSERTALKKLNESDYNFCAILGKLDEIQRLNDQWEAYFLNNGYTPTRIYYEDIDRDYSGTICDIANNVFCMSICRESIPMPTLKKQRDALTEYYVSRFYADWDTNKKEHGI